MVRRVRHEAHNLDGDVTDRHLGAKGDADLLQACVDRCDAGLSRIGHAAVDKRCRRTRATDVESEYREVDVALRTGAAGEEHTDGARGFDAGRARESCDI